VCFKKINNKNKTEYVNNVNIWGGGEKRRELKIVVSWPHIPKLK
jgi:glutaredoxin-related protein